jgi:hypothetical protein
MAHGRKGNGTFPRIRRRDIKYQCIDSRMFSLSRQTIEFFFPQTFKDGSDDTSSPDDSSGGYPHSKFFLNFYFHGPSILRIPIREFSQDWRYQSLSLKSWRTRDFGWIDLKVQEEASLCFSIPLLSSRGHYEFQLDFDCGESHALTSVNFANFVSWQHIRFQAKLNSPLKWNGDRRWEIELNLDHPDFFFIRDHLYLLTDLTQDWLWQSDTPLLERHIPYLYNYSILFSNASISFYVNECNIIDFPDELSENSKSGSLGFSWILLSGISPQSNGRI